MKKIGLFRILIVAGVFAVVFTSPVCAWGTITSGTFDSPPADEDLAEWYAVYKVGDKYVVDASPRIAMAGPVVCSKGSKSLFHLKAPDGTPENYLIFSSPTDKYIKITSEDDTIASADMTAFYCNNVGRTKFHIDSGVYSPATWAGESLLDVIVYDVETNDVSIRQQVTAAIDKAWSVLVNGGELPSSIDQKTADILYDIMVTGKKMGINLGVNLITADSIPEEGKNKINEKIDENDKIVSYYDIDIETSEENVDGAGHVKELDDDIEVLVDLPETEAPKSGFTRKYFAIRLHNGVAERINIEKVGNKGKIRSDRFSVYAIGYSDSIGSPDTGVNTNEERGAIADYGVALFGGIILVELVVIYFIRKEKR